MKLLFSFIILFFPWKLRRLVLNKVWKYKIHETAKIGFAYIYPKELIMNEGSRIDHFNVAINLDKIIIGKNSSIGRSNWITGFSSVTKSIHFNHQPERKSILMIGIESAITKHHHIDCTNEIKVGNYVTIAGYYSQFLTHSINIYENYQDSSSIIIGDYSFISTGVKILGGSEVPAFSVLGAGAVLNKKLEKQYTLYAGVPAKAVKNLPIDSKYFLRKSGFVF